MGYEVYLHGQILGTHSFLLKGEFVQPDEYSEIKEKYFLPTRNSGGIFLSLLLPCFTISQRRGREAIFISRFDY